MTLIDPNPRPWNPFGGMHSLLQSLDPSRALRTLIRHRNADLVVSVFEGGALPLILLRRLLAYKVPLVLWDVALTESWALRERILDIVMPRVEGVMVLNSSHKSYIERRWPRCRRIDVIGHNVDTDFFAPVNHGAGGYVLSIGDDIGRDFATLVHAAEGVEADFVLKTRQPLALDPVRHQNIRVLRERFDFSELRRLYAECRFVAVPLANTLNASGVSTILEAGAMGKATIVSMSNGISDFVVPEETCLVVPPHDVGAFNQAIRRLLSDPATCNRLGANARRFVERQFSLAAFADRFAVALRGFGRPEWSDGPSGR